MFDVEGLAWVPPMWRKTWALFRSVGRQECGPVFLGVVCLRQRQTRAALVGILPSAFLDAFPCWPCAGAEV